MYMYRDFRVVHVVYTCWLMILSDQPFDSTHSTRVEINVHQVKKDSLPTSEDSFEIRFVGTGVADTAPIFRRSLHSRKKSSIFAAAAAAQPANASFFIIQLSCELQIASIRHDEVLLRGFCHPWRPCCRLRCRRGLVQSHCHRKSPSRG